MVRTPDIVNNLQNYRILKYGAGGRLATLMGPEHPPSFKAKYYTQNGDELNRRSLRSICKLDQGRIT